MVKKIKAGIVILGLAFISSAVGLAWWLLNKKTDEFAKAHIGNIVGGDIDLADCDSINIQRFPPVNGITRFTFDVPVTNIGQSKGTLFVTIRREFDPPNAFVHEIELPDVEINVRNVVQLEMFIGANPTDVVIEAWHLENEGLMKMDNICAYQLSPQ